MAARPPRRGRWPALAAAALGVLCIFGVRPPAAWVVARGSGCAAHWLDQPHRCVTARGAAGAEAGPSPRADEGIADTLCERGPWLLEATVGSEVARSLGGNGLLAESDAPERKLGPYKLSFQRYEGRSAADRGLGTVIRGIFQLEPEAAEPFTVDGFWTLGPVPEREAKQMGLEPTAASLELLLFSEKGLAVDNDGAWTMPWEGEVMYIPKRERVTFFAYLQGSGSDVRVVGQSAVTVLEGQWNMLVQRKIVGRVSRFFPAVLAAAF